MKAKHLLILFISIIPLFGDTKKETAKSKQKPKDITEQVFESEAFRDSKSAPDRYKVPVHLLKEIVDLPEVEKEQKLKDWFDDKEKKLIRRLIFLKIFWRSIVLLIAVLSLGLFLYYTLRYGINLLFEFIALLFPSLTNTLTRILTWMNSIFSWIPAPQIVPPAIPQGTIPIARFFGRYIVNGLLLFSNAYLLKILRYLWGIIKDFIKLSKLYYNPVREDPLRRAEHMYITSIYLHLQYPYRIKFLEELLFNTRSGDISKVNETYQLLKAYRALPHGVKPVVYDQDLIDELFENYPPEIRKVAEQIIAKFIVCTEAIQIGRADLLEDIAMKGILLYGPPGTGKSNFFKLICHALDINHITLVLMNAEDARGKGGDKIGHGQPSAYAKALLRATDERGRNYLNSIIIVEEIDKTPPEVAAFMHMFLDPKVREIDDDYLHVKIPKIPFIFGTTNYKENLATAIKDRFNLVKVGAIGKKYKKAILRNYLIPAWVDLLANSALQENYDHYLDAHEYERLLIEKLDTYIDTQDTGPGMRPIEEELERVSMEIMAEIFRAEYEEQFYPDREYQDYPQENEYAQESQDVEESRNDQESEHHEYQKESQEESIEKIDKPEATPKTPKEDQKPIKKLKSSWDRGQRESGDWGNKLNKEFWITPLAEQNLKEAETLDKATDQAKNGLKEQKKIPAQREDDTFEEGEEDRSDYEWEEDDEWEQEDDTEEDLEGQKEEATEEEWEEDDEWEQDDDTEEEWEDDDEWEEELEEQE